MKERIILWLALLAPFAVFGQQGRMAEQFVLSSQFLGNEEVNDSTYQVTISHPFSQINVAYLPNQIQVGFIAADPTGRRYRVASIVSTALNSSVLNLVELQDDGPPSGAGVIYEKPPNGDFILQEVILERISPAFQAMINNHNSINAGSGSGSLDSTRYSLGVLMYYEDGSQIGTDTILASHIKIEDIGNVFVVAENVEQGLAENGVNIAANGLTIVALNTALGISVLDEDMGTYTSPIIPDNATQKAINEAIGAAIEAIPGGDNLGDHLATEDLDMSGNKITNLDDGTVSSDAVNFGQLDNAISNISASDVLATPHGNITGVTVQDQLEQLVASTDFGRVWYVSKESGDNSTGAVGDFFKPFRDPFFLIDSVGPGDLVYIQDGYFYINLLSTAAILDNSVAGQYPELGANNVTYYWSPGTGIEHIGSCVSNTGFFKCGHRSAGGWTDVDFPEGQDDYKIQILGNGTFKNATLYHYAMRGDRLVPGTARYYPPRSAYIQCDTIENAGAHIELYGGDLNITADIKTSIASDQCTGGGRAVVHFGSFGSQSAFTVDSITGVFNITEMYVSSEGGTSGNVNYSIFGNSGAGGASKDFADLNLTLNCDYLEIDSVAYEGAFSQWVSGTTGERMNISVNAKTAIQKQSSLSAFVDIEGVVSGNITVNVDNAELEVPLYTDDGGSTDSENLNLTFAGNYKLNEEGVRLTGTGRTDGRTVRLTGIYDCDKQLVKSTATEADLPVKIIFTGTALKGDSTLFQGEKNIYFYGNTDATSDVFSDPDLMTVFVSDNLFTGWAEYRDTTYTESGPFTINPDVKYTLPNNFDIIVDHEKPIDFDSFISMADTAIVGRNGDGLEVFVEFLAVPVSFGTTYIDASIDIGGSVGEIFPRTFGFVKGQGEPLAVSFSIAGYNLSTWEGNSGKIKVVSDGEVDIYNIRWVLTRTHKSRAPTP